MPTKTTKNGREYEVDGKRFVWHPLDDNDQTGTLPDVLIPLRIKLGLVRKVAAMTDDNHAQMFEILAAVAPGHADTIDEMDVLDFEEMFTTWQAEYNALSGASLGESSGSSA